ncbi:unnamed protein product [Rotaria sp. Silwood2]|nr:unnamed protein product [Rotaria sp. Silwood2]
MIVSGALEQHIIPEIQACPQLDSIYVFCDDQSVHEPWANAISKVKGVYTKIEPICEALQKDCKQCDRGMISISFRGIDPLFMYTQLLKEVFLEIDDDDTAVKELVNYCRLQGDVSNDHIDKLEQEYHLQSPIWWYTAPYFLFTMLNRGLRLMDVNILLKMGFFIRNLHRHIENLHGEQQSINTTGAKFEVYRGQSLSIEDFEKLKQTQGGLMSFNNFLSTTRNRNLSLEIYARPAALYNLNIVGILFVMIIDPQICATSSVPFVDVKQVGFFEDQEEEILFTTHTIFRIDHIKQIDDDHTDRLWEAHLNLEGNDNNELNTLTAHIREELTWDTGWSRLGQILITLGESSKAKQIYEILLEAASSDDERANYSHRLGIVYNDMGEHSKALLSYERMTVTQNNTSTIKCLLKLDVHPDVIVFLARKALKHAAEHSHIIVIQLIREAEADPTMQDFEGKCNKSVLDFEKKATI